MWTVGISVLVGSGSVGEGPILQFQAALRDRRGVRRMPPAPQQPRWRQQAKGPFACSSHACSMATTSLERDCSKTVPGQAQTERLYRRTPAASCGAAEVLNASLIIRPETLVRWHQINAIANQTAILDVLTEIKDRGYAASRPPPSARPPHQADKRHTPGTLAAKQATASIPIVDHRLRGRWPRVPRYARARPSNMAAMASASKSLALIGKSGDGAKATKK
jgi:hypothetical protein